MRILKFFGKLLLVLAVLYVPVYHIYAGSAKATEAEIVIDTLKVNGKVLQTDRLNDIVIAREDSITFIYHCHVTQGEQTPIRFRITLARDSNSASMPWNRTFFSYRNLQEGSYRVLVEAFNPRNDFHAEPASFSFRVNNKEASLVKELEKYKQMASKKDTVVINNSTGNIFKGNIDWFSSIAGLLLGAIAVSLLFITMRSKKGNGIDSKIDKEDKIIIRKLMEGEEMAGKTPEISKADFDRLLTENSNLRAEIAALRGQIDALYTRTEDLNKQNRELKDNIDRLSTSKTELEELQKQKDDLFAVIIHDIKNPAALIKSLVDLLRSYDLTANEQQEIINDIFETTTKIVMLSQEVSKILTLEGNKVPLRLDLVNIAEVVKDVYRRNNIAAVNKNIEMLLDIPDEVPETIADAQKIDEVVENLISNAIKFSSSGGKIRVSTVKIDNNLVVEVSDNGPGLSEDDIKKAFQRGIRLSALPTAGEPSSGFGLWIVKKLVEAHKGHVWVKSVQGKGSTFSFSLPLVTDDSNF